MTLDDRYLAAKRTYDEAKAKHGARSIYAAIAMREMQQITARILRRDNRKRRAA